MVSNQLTLHVLIGVHQGGVPSLLLFTCYVYLIISQLKYAGLGFHFAVMLVVQCMRMIY